MSKYFVYRSGQKKAHTFKSFVKAAEFASENLYKEEDILFIDECLSFGVFRLASMVRRDNQNHLIAEVLGDLPKD